MEEENIINPSSLDEIKRPYPPLDYTIKDPVERNQKVHEIVNSVSPEQLTPYYLEELTRYLIQTNEAKKQKEILTENRMVTINRHETSYEGLVSKLENGEDGIYNFMSGENKSILLIPKIKITDEEVNQIPGLRELREEITKIQLKQKAARGRQKFLLTKQLIQMRQDQYVLRSIFKPPITMTKVTKSPNKIDLTQHITIDENGEPVSDCLISLFNPEHICYLLCNYSSLKQNSYGFFDDDWWYLMQDLDNLIEKALKDKYPILYDIMILKIDGVQNKYIVEQIKEKYNVTYSVEYLSAVWRKKIPKIIADKAKQDWIIWHYTVEEKGQWKRCSRCHEVKLAHPYFFSRNKTAKDGWYSMCKCCRNKK